MKKKFTEEQIVKILRDADCSGVSIADVCRKHGVSEQSFYRWRQQYGSMSVGEIRRLRELEKENARLKRLLAERSLEVDVMKEILEKN